METSYFYIEERIKHLLIEMEKLESDVARHQVKWAYWEQKDDKSHPPDSLLEEDDYLVAPFQNLATWLYISIVYYLDSKDLDQYLKLFLSEFGENPNEPNHRDSFGYDHYWSDEYYSDFLFKIRKFLSVFEFFESSTDYYKRLSGIQYLERILRNTASIIHKAKKNPSSETKVYKAVQNIIEAVFPTSMSPRSNFFKTAKEYKPDILIPELKVAIEYKYSKTEEKLKTTIEQIAADVKGYTGDKDYKLFYAVFFVTEDFWGLERFEEVWKEQNFPKNWLAFYVVGKGA
jgi:uncharacterized protein YfbU (UPF0304 family)